MSELPMPVLQGPLHPPSRTPQGFETIDRRVGILVGVGVPLLIAPLYALILRCRRQRERKAKHSLAAQRREARTPIETDGDPRLELADGEPCFEAECIPLIEIDHEPPFDPELLAKAPPAAELREQANICELAGHDPAVELDGRDVHSKKGIGIFARGAM